MEDAKLKFDGREITIDRDVTTIGRISENIVSFPDDSNVSRYHAEIERRGGDHWLIDLKSSNGTTVNDKVVGSEVRLEPGDKIVLGGSSELQFMVGGAASGDPLESGPMDVPGMSRAQSEVGSLGYEAQSGVEYAVQGAARNAICGSVGSGLSSAATPVASTSSSPTILIAGAVAGLAVVCVVAAGAFYMTRGSTCVARASIVKPEAGDTINAPVEIEVKMENTDCVQKAVFTIDGQEVASAEAPSFAVTLDPKDLPELADGVDHALQIVLIDGTGEKIPQSGAVMLAFETRAVTKPPPTPGVTVAKTQPGKQTGRGQPSLVQINDMSQRLVKQFSGSFIYNISNKQFLQEVQKRTAEYAQDGYSQRAAAFRDTINVAFVREQNIDAPFGFILAMSRSKFIPTKQGDDEGLWRMTSAFANESKYNGQCGTETLSDQSQNCAARSAALYMKAIIFGVFDGDLVYSAVAFGKSPQDAGVWKATLPQNRADVWNAVRTPAEREQLIRFFAAGIVSENPQAFGLTKDRPLSELYRVTM